MIVIEGPGEHGSSSATDLAKVTVGSIQIPSPAPKALTVGLLEQALLERFPREDAEEWDRTGLLVGDPSAPITGVCVALDPTRQAVQTASSLKGNVLLTHHPAYLDPPERLSPSYDCASVSGVNVWAAVKSDVALMNFHTALDVSDEARVMYMQLLGLDYERMLVASQANPRKGYGYLCAIREDDLPFDLARMAARCTSVFGRAPRLWGEPSRRISTVVFANGSAGDVVEACVKARVDCLICGEVRYHAALDALQAGLSIVEVGHDASELPLTAVLASAVVDAGVSADLVRVIDQAGNWFVPDSTRL